MNIQAYNKAIAAVVVPLILNFLNTVVGISPDTSVDELVEFLVMTAVTAIAVYLVPNKRD